jgi:hypothetical protein
MTASGVRRARAQVGENPRTNGEVYKVHPLSTPRKTFRRLDAVFFLFDGRTFSPVRSLCVP